MSAIDIPAIRGTLGKLTYYTATFTFKQIAERVKPADDELHTSKSLREQLQRALTDNHKSITEYILTQKEHFFNALVLAVYDGDPTWNELEFEYNDIRHHSMGFLHLNGKERIFPVDGQHRVEGIKSALLEDPKLKDETITVIFIGHHNTREGKEKTRRIFSTLNRYAKPVSPGDIIALDEDDTVAIVTRNLLESFPLFMNDKIGSAKSSKALSNDSKSFTSLLTLYETNKIIYKYYITAYNNKNKLCSTSEMGKLLKFRPTQDRIDAFEKHLIEFWTNFTDSFCGVKEFQKAEADAALPYRNRENGGLLYFRPIALPQLITAILETHFRTKKTISECMLIYSGMEMCISKKPWINILWDPDRQTMIMTNASLIPKLLIYLYDSTILSVKEVSTLKKQYAKALGIDIDQIDEQLNTIKM